MMNKSYDTTTRITLPAPAGGVVSGRFYRIGRFFGCAVATVPAGKPFTLDREGIWKVKAEGQGAAITPGAPIYWEAGRADAEFHNDGTDVGSFLVGTAMEGHAVGTGEIDVAIEPCHANPIV